MDQQQCTRNETTSHRQALNRAESPPSPVPSGGRKRTRSSSTTSTSNSGSNSSTTSTSMDEEAETMVAMLSSALAKMNARMDGQDDEDDDESMRMCAFTTTYVAFVEALADELLGGTERFAAYMALFDAHDRMEDGDRLLHRDRRVRRALADEMRQQLRRQGVRPDALLRCVDTVFARFYTREAPARQQKEHGQFYTPQSVVRFMWTQCVGRMDVGDGETVRVPRVLDPCMGMGAFLCEFLARLVGRLDRHWDNARALRQLLCTDIPANVWGVELDPVALRLAKLNMLVHLLPLYRRLRELGVAHDALVVDRLHVFCSDTLRLTPLDNDNDNDDDDTWAHAELQRLRTALKFEYIVTNPPYMIRKTGRIAEPDPALYDARILGGRGMQAYVYFMWICLQRCDPHAGELCLITPSQWLVLEFARHLRAWMWEHCELLQIFQLEPYKVWPRVQTDSLIFRLRMRGAHDPDPRSHALFLRHMVRRAALDDILAAYAAFDGQQPPASADIAYKRTPTHDRTRIHTSPNASFAFLSPSTSLADQLAQLTHALPRLCDGAGAPLVFHRGPNTHPVYALVVRTAWAREHFGAACCERWLRPAFYWSGKTAGSDGIESAFWRARDPKRLARKETSPAEAYTPFYAAADPVYSLLLVDRDGAATLQADTSAADAPLREYLRAARAALQPDKHERALAWCHYNQCGADVPVKIVHPINCGYFTRSQPRQRFFVDRRQLCVTNQCMYFTPAASTAAAPLEPEFFCGLLNSSTVQFFLREHCAYDQQRRTRFFGRHLANVPCCALPPHDPTAAARLTDLVHAATAARLWVYAVVWASGAQAVVEPLLRAGAWDVAPADAARARTLSVADLLCGPHAAAWPPDVHAHWVSHALAQHPTMPLDTALRRLLKLASLCQHGIDQLAYALYCIPPHLQRALEDELGLASGAARWAHIALPAILDAAHDLLLHD